MSRTVVNGVQGSFGGLKTEKIHINYNDTTFVFTDPVPGLFLFMY